MSKRVGIINSGGDCPGLNTVIDAIYRNMSSDYEVLGFYRGFEGLLSLDYSVLDSFTVSANKFRGGTFLKSVNKGNFAVKKGMGVRATLDPEVVRKTCENYQGLGLDGLIVLGGDGSMCVADIFTHQGLNIIGVPKSIDNDLGGTSMTFGFMTAVQIATEALDRLETTGHSHDRVMVLEVMGRNAGWIATYAGIAGGANAILIPEIDFSPEKIKNLIKERIKSGKTSSLIVVAEGAKEVGGEISLKDHGGTASEASVGGVGDKLVKYLNQDPEIEARCTVLGHVQRGGTPVAMDRFMSRRYGAHAAELFRQGKFGYMVSYEHGAITEEPIDKCIDKIKTVDPAGELIKTATDLGISFGA